MQSSDEGPLPAQRRRVILAELQRERAAMSPEEREQEEAELLEATAAVRRTLSRTLLPKSLLTTALPGITHIHKTMFDPGSALATSIQGFNQSFAEGLGTAVLKTFESSAAAEAVRRASSVNFGVATGVLEAFASSGTFSWNTDISALLDRLSVRMPTGFLEALSSTALADVTDYDASEVSITSPVDPADLARTVTMLNVRVACLIQQLRKQPLHPATSQFLWVLVSLLLTILWTYYYDGVIKP